MKHAYLMGNIVAVLSIFFIANEAGAFAPNEVSSPEAWRSSLTWDYDGERILGHDEKIIHLWSADTGRSLLSIPLETEPILLRFNRKHSWIISVTDWGGPLGDCWDEAMMGALPRTDVWDARTGAHLASYPAEVFAAISDNDDQMMTYAVTKTYDPKQFNSPTASCGALPSWNVTLKNRNLLTHSETPLAEVKAFVVPSRVVHRMPAIGFSPEGTLIYANGYLWQSLDKKQKVEVPAQAWTFYNGAFYAFAYSGTSVWYADQSTPQELSAVPSKLVVRSTAWDPAGKWVASIVPKDGRYQSSDCLLEVWSTTTRSTSVSSSVGARCGRSPILVSPRGDRLIFQGVQNAELFDPIRRAVIGLIGDGIAQQPIGFSPDGSKLLTAGKSFTVYDSATGKAMRHLTLDSVSNTSLIDPYNPGAYGSR